MEVKKDTVFGCISHHAYAKDVLAPGLVLYLWVFGCLKNCSNCMSKFLKDIKKFTDVRELIDRIFDEAIAKGINGIVISGGEPLLQPEVFEYLIEKTTDYNLTSSGRKLFIHVYTGYKYEDLKKDHRLRTIISRLDILVDGEYFEELDDDSQKVKFNIDTMKEELPKFSMFSSNEWNRTSFKKAWENIFGIEADLEDT